MLALRSNIARTLTGLDHREFATRLADSSLLQWFLRVGEMDSIKAFSKSTSDRLSRWVGEQAVRTINEKLTALLAATAPQAGKAKTPAAAFGLAEPICFDDVYFDSTCLKADIHFPIDWVLLRDASRTLMKATTLIRKHGLKHRMPQEPLDFLSDMNTLCMKMSDKSHAADGRKHRRKVLREMKELGKRIAAHARAHVEILKARREETDLTEPQAQLIIRRIGSVLEQLPAAVKQAHERIIGGRRRVATEGRIGIFKNVFLGRPLRAKGFEHRELAVGWAVLTHNLWVVARMAEAEKKRKEDQERKSDRPQARAA